MTDDERLAAIKELHRLDDIDEDLRMVVIGNLLSAVDYWKDRAEKAEATRAMTKPEQIDGLAYALSDTFNTCKFADLTEDDRRRYFDRAAVLLAWLNNRGVELTEAAKRDHAGQRQDHQDQNDQEQHTQNALRSPALIGVEPATAKQHDNQNDD